MGAVRAVGADIGSLFILLKHLQGNGVGGGGGVGAVRAVGAVGAVRAEGVWAHIGSLYIHLQGRPGSVGAVGAGR